MSVTFTGPVPVPSAQSSPLSILITGASRGIGYGLVQQYAQAHPKNIIFAGVRHPEGETSKNLRTFAQEHPNVHIIPLDVSNEHSISSSVSHVSKVVKHVDLIINNAGVLIGGERVDTATSEGLISTYTTNVVGPFLVVRSYLSLLQSSSAPQVINVSSSLGSNAYAYLFNFPFVSYGTSKAALNYMNTVLSHAYPTILFLTIHPGWVDTDMGNAAGGKPPTEIQDTVKAIRYYAATKNVTKNQGEYLDITNGQILPF
jgi:NAD(P)-dependent dehydrogenase (short-subunit alcohol dehydrogenase family)